MLKRIIHPEKQYLNLVKDVLIQGDTKIGRNGATKSIFGAQMRFNLRNNTIPLLTTKKVAWKTCLRELLWFIHGSTDNEILRKQKVNIWNKNATKEFLESRGLSYKKGDLGPIYGHQWRFFNAKYDDCTSDYTNKGVDQLQNVIDALQGTHPSEDKYSRRLLVNAWNPCQLNEMALPPCHVLFQFYVNQRDELSCSLYQRSGDIGLGVPFNIASYSFLTHLIAHHCGLKVGEFVHTIADCHIYDDHFDALETQVMREPYEFPKLYIHSKHTDINDYKERDFTVQDYKYHSKLTMEMRA